MNTHEVDSRQVTHVSRNPDGTIRALGNPNEKWLSRSKESVIRDIAKHTHDYYVKQGTEEVKIGIVHTGGKYLRTDPDDPEALDNLADLPDFFVDDFEVTSGKLIVSDPCYKWDDEYKHVLHVVEPAKNGLWRATAEITAEGRILTAVCEKTKSVGEMEQFEVGVDSAQAGIFCAGLYWSSENPNPGFYKACCEATQKGELNAGIVMGRGVVSTSVDDGSYQAFVGRDKHGLAVEVRIELSE